MPRPKSPPGLEVREMFEASRLAPQCLIIAYGRVVPVPRKKILKVVRDQAQPPTTRSQSRGGEHA
jgi:hypothetical protein